MWPFGPKVREIFQELEKTSFFINEVENPLYGIKEYIKSSEGQLISDMKKLIEEENARLKYEEENYKKDDITWPEPRYYDNIEVINLHYISNFIFLYAFLEKKMKKLAEISENKSHIKLIDISSDWIFKYRKFLKKICNIDFSKMKNEWKQIVQYSDLRNVLVHSDTIDKNYNKEKVKNIRKIKFIQILEETSDVLNIRIENSDMLIDFLEIIKIFLNKIYYGN